MKPIACLILFGCIGVILTQVFRPKREARSLLVLLLSLGFLFYCSPSGVALGLILAWVFTVFFIARRASRNSGKFPLVPLYIVAVIATFCAFKLGLFTVLEKGSLIENAMPIGFSFIMFHSIALVLDRQRSDYAEPLNFREYFASALFFPTLAIGPFHKFQVFQKSLSNDWSSEKLFQGYCLVCLGAMKLGISGVFLKPYFLKGMPIVFVPERNMYHPALILLQASVFLFANFSGYSDLVVGFAKMMGFDVPPNFRFPFLARSMADYWRNWHISLGAWFKEYVFMPLNYKLATSESVKLRTATTAAVAVFVTFFLIGMWHEFSLKILVYSIVNGLLVACFLPNNKNPWIGIPLTFVWALLINGIFLCRDLATFEKLMASMLDLEPRAVRPGLGATGICIVLLAVFWAAERLVESLGTESARWPRLIVFANFIFCLLALFVGVSLGIGRADAVYIGY